MASTQFIAVNGIASAERFFAKRISTNNFDTIIKLPPDEFMKVEFAITAEAEDWTNEQRDRAANRMLALPAAIIIAAADNAERQHEKALEPCAGKIAIENLESEKPRRIIPIPRSQYIDNHGQPFHPIFGSFRYWPRAMQGDFNRYSRFLDRLWSRLK